MGRGMGFGLPANKIDWFLYAPSNELHPHAEYIPWRMQEEQSMDLSCIGRGIIKKSGKKIDYSLEARRG